MNPGDPSSGRDEAAPRAPRRAASFMIALVLGLQFVAAFKLLCPPRQFPSLAPLRVVCPPALWPFTDYQMYGAAFSPPVDVTVHEPIGRLDDGEEVPLDAESLGLSHDRWRRLFVDAIRRRKTERVVDGVDRFFARTGRRVESIRLIERRYRLVEGGDIEELPARVALDLELPPAEPAEGAREG